MSDEVPALPTADSIIATLAPPSPRQRRAAAATAAILAVFTAAVLPWAHAPGPEIPAVVAMFTSVSVIIDLAIAFLLLAQIGLEADLSTFLVACAYVFSSVMGIGHVLTFPDALVHGARVFGGPQLTSYIFTEWRIGFPSLLLASALALPRQRVGAAARPHRSLRALPYATAAFAVLLAVTSEILEPVLPPMISRDGFTMLGLGLSWIGVGLSLAAIAVIWTKTRGRDVLHLWLVVALLAFCSDLVLSTSGAGRFTLGWYAGRASGFVSACTLFLVMLVQFAVQQRYAVETTRVLRQRTIGLQVEMARRAEAEERLLHAQKIDALGQLTGGIAHDFNNLLAAIMGNLDLLRRRASLDARGSRLLENALVGAERGRSLTARLLVFSRIQKLTRERVLVSTLFDNLNTLLHTALGPGISVVFDPGEADLGVLADSTQLELALLNLAINARDAMSTGGTLTITARAAHVAAGPDLAEGDYITLTVSDTGTGMAPDVLKRAFEPFFTTKDVGRGTGLGLSQVFGVATRAGGTARIASRPGEGTSVHVILPRAFPVPEPSAPPAAPAATAWAAGGKALVIDDDQGVREMLVGLLQDLGLSVAEAPDGQSGLAMLPTHEPDLLVVDFAMPDMNGAEVAKEARRRRPSLPVVFVSGFADTDAIDRAVGAEALILRKPFRAGELRAVLSQAFERRCRAP